MESRDYFFWNGQCTQKYQSVTGRPYQPTGASAAPPSPVNFGSPREHPRPLLPPTYLSGLAGALVNTSPKWWTLANGQETGEHFSIQRTLRELARVAGRPPPGHRNPTRPVRLPLTQQVPVGAHTIERLVY